MIKNNWEYEVTQDCIEKFEKSIAAIEKDEERKTNDPERWAMRRGAAQCHLDKLEAEKAEYEMLTSHDSQAPIVLELDDIDYLPDILIKARIAAKLSEKELGALCGCIEEQIKRYEKDDYQSASFLDFRRVIFALNIKIQSGKFLIELDTLERTPITIEDLRSSKSRAKSQEVVNESKQFQP
ncbi:hypothetical protein DSM106972_014010 [Dulcicalothrix desertica PCC 7102]|uniref:Uncharacterized protein n=1 Tax=Dulcicalothrix desertica PCC 7102 TaxID=232991 RepID=A0A3S1APV8_9CYAN|nr:DNA-binding protein [Dulcicalothrix desertica]RUT08233.1 hypothetical protein DSM106972_014010 [Dulcicalothrix desertica PCC 7102]TWH40104.1 hypothetical protein CAL7102_09400 [Dulcicalothrix desertica PCC 7102]